VSRNSTSEDAVDPAVLWTQRTRPQGRGNYKTVSTAPTALIFCSKNRKPNRREPEVSTLSWEFTRKIEHVAPRSTLSFAKTGATLLPLTLATSLELIAEMIAMVGRCDGGIPRSGSVTNFVWEKFGFAV